MEVETKWRGREPGQTEQTATGRSAGPAREACSRAPRVPNASRERTEAGLCRQNADGRVPGSDGSVDFWRGEQEACAVGEWTRGNGGKKELEQPEAAMNGVGGRTRRA